MHQHLEECEKMKVVADWDHEQTEDDAGGRSYVETQFSSEEVRHSAEYECSQDETHDSQGKQVGNIIGLERHVCEGKKSKMICCPCYLRTDPVIFSDHSVVELRLIIEKILTLCQCSRGLE